MKAVYIQKGENLDFMNETKKVIGAGDVVVYGNHVGIAGTDIQPGTTGSLHVTGVYQLAKSSTDGITAGTDVYWDGSGITTDAETGTGDSAVKNTQIGYAASNSAAGESHAKVRIG